MWNKLKKFFRKQGFTLVELIIVIAIISILAVAAFMMLTKWLASSRDSRRLADLGTIKKALEIDYTVLWHYPDPDEKKSILDKNDNEMWYVGHIGNSVIDKIDSLMRAPLDPSDSSNYSYAITLNKQEYQVWALLEKWETISKLLNNTYAIQREFTQEDIGSLSADIDGKYDWFISYATWGVTYIVRTDSLLVYTGDSLDTSGANHNLMLDEKLLWEEAILRDLDIPDGTPNDIIIVRAKKELWLTWGNITWDNLAINIIESNTSLKLIPIKYKHCELDGTLIAHGDSINTYVWDTVAFDNTCEPVSRLCDAWELSAWPNFQICRMEDAEDCTLDRQAVAHGDNINAYSESSIIWDATYDCTNRLESRTCYNWGFDKDNSFQYVACAKLTPRNCDANTSYSYNGHIYNVPALNHYKNATPTVNISENNGIYKYTFNVTCNDWSYNESETGPDLVNCNTSYHTEDNSTCVADTRACTIIEWVGSQDWNGTSWDTCTVTSCNDWFYDSGNSCLAYTYTRFIWDRSSCSATCGGGTKTRLVTCERNDSLTVDDSYCLNKPATSETCNTQACCTRTCSTCRKTCTRNDLWCSNCDRSGQVACPWGKASIWKCRDRRKSVSYKCNPYSCNCSCR